MSRERSNLVQFLHPGRVLDLAQRAQPVQSGRPGASPRPGRSLPRGVTERTAGRAWRGGASLSRLTTCEPVVAPPGACSPRGRSPSWRLGLAMGGAVRASPLCTRTGRGRVSIWKVTSSVVAWAWFGVRASGRPQLWAKQGLNARWSERGPKCSCWMWDSDLRGGRAAGWSIPRGRG